MNWFQKLKNSKWGMVALGVAIIAALYVFSFSFSFSLNQPVVSDDESSHDGDSEKEKVESMKGKKEGMTGMSEMAGMDGSSSDKNAGMSAAASGIPQSVAAMSLLPSVLTTGSSILDPNTTNLLVNPAKRSFAEISGQQRDVIKNPYIINGTQMEQPAVSTKPLETNIPTIQPTIYYAGRSH